MQLAKSFHEILMLRGRIVIFTASATIAQPFEQHAERNNARVIYLRGHADWHGPLKAWHDVHNNGLHGVLSLSQIGHVTGFKIPATDLVWIGDLVGQQASFDQAMQRARGDFIRRWLLADDAVTPRQRRDDL